MKTFSKICLAIVGLFLILSVAGWYSRVKVEIVNLGPVAIGNVSVHIKGHSYQIGDIASGASQTVRISPGSETSVLIEYRDDTGTWRKRDIETYLEGGYTGKITVQVKKGKIVHVEQNIKVTILDGLL